MRRADYAIVPRRFNRSRVKIPSRATLNHWLYSRDAPVFVQFAKYGAAGAISTVLLLAISMTLSFTVIPAMDGMVVDGAPITDALRERNLMINNVIAFPFANTVAYLLNVGLIFTPGRHSKWVEFWLFTGISFLSFFAGLVGGPKLIGWFGVSSLFAQFSLMITSALVTYVCRKFLIFAK